MPLSDAMQSLEELGQTLTGVSFGSDNHCEVHPAIMRALEIANHSHTHSYGLDPFTVAAEEHFLHHFGDRAKVFFVFNGTAANVVSLAACARSFEAVICSSDSHIQNNECGAPEKHVGCKLLLCPTTDGKITPEMLRPHLSGRGDQHVSQAAVVSISQPTELGTLYSVKEITAISEFCKSHGLYLHVDGARLSNAAAALNASFKSFTTDLGVDIVSFGGTKNGLMYGEAVVVLNPKLAKDLAFIRKQLLQLPSKSRFVGAQFCAYFENNLWQEIALHENKLANSLAGKLSDLGVKPTQKVETNAIFVPLQKGLVKTMREKFFFYVWNAETFEIRLMTTFSTTEKDVNEFVEHWRVTHQLP